MPHLATLSNAHNARRASDRAFFTARKRDPACITNLALDYDEIDGETFWSDRTQLQSRQIGTGRVWE